jgi:hypothetical protein
MDKFYKYLPVFLLGAITLTTFIPFIFTGFSNGDDIIYYLNAKGGHLLTLGNIYAKDQGRFYFLLTVPIAHLFYLFDNYLVSKSINMILVFLDFILIGFIAKEVFVNKWYGFLCYLLMVAFVSIKGLYNPIVSYPGYFSGSFLLILASIYFVLRFKNTGVKNYKLISVIFYSVGLLFYESYIMYLPLIVLIACTIYSDIKIPLFKRLRNALPYIFSSFIYCTLYISFRILHPSNYIGARLSSHISFLNCMNVILNFSGGSYPLVMTLSGGGYTYGGIDYLFQNNLKNILSFILSEHFEWIFKSIIITLLLYYFFYKITLAKPNNIFIILIITFFYIYLPHIPLSLAERYIACGGFPYYTTTYFSMFAATLCLTILIILLCYKIKSFKYRNLIFIVISCFIGLISIINDFANYQAVKFLRVPMNICNIVDEFAKTKEYKQLSDNSLIYAPSLYDERSIYGMDWSAYLYYKSNNKPVKIAKSRDELLKEIKNEKTIYYLNYSRNQNDIDQFIAFSSISKKSQIDSTRETVISDSSVIYYYSLSKSFSILFNTLPDSSSNKSVIINNHTIITKQNQIELDVTNKNYKNYFMTITIKSKSIDLNSISITNIKKPGSFPIKLD